MPIYRLLAAALLALASPTLAAPGGLSGLQVRSLDIMKYTKDTLRNQPSDILLDRLVDGIAAGFNLTHIAIAVPLDANADYPEPKPSHRTAEAFTAKLCDTIHGHGLNVLHRGTWLGIEGLYGAEKRVGAKRVPPGSALAVMQGRDADTWLGKTYRYILDHPALFADGDIWAILPERTEGIFSEAGSFLPYDQMGIQQQYAAFFTDLAVVSKVAFAHIGRKVTVGWTANNFSEVKSGWLPQWMFRAAGIVPFDHYGETHTPEELDHDLRSVWDSRGRLPLCHQEWGDHWNKDLPAPARLTYLHAIFDVLSRLAGEGKLVAFNYWGGWTGEAEGVLRQTGTAADPHFEPNERGMVLASYLAR